MIMVFVGACSGILCLIQLAKDKLVVIVLRVDESDDRLNNRSTRSGTSIVKARDLVFVNAKI